MTRASLWRWVLALWLGSTLCAALIRPVTPIDETRYLTVAWVMWLAGDPWLPSLNGLPYSDKPPLLFWLINAGWSLFGVNDLWPRLLTAAFGLGVALLTARCAVLLCDGRPGIGSRAALILMAFSPWLLFNGSVMFDVLLTLFSLTAIVFVLGMRGAGRLWQWAATGVALGLGMLAKGPAALLHVLPLALLAPLWKDSLERSAWRDRSRWYRRLFFSLGISVVVLALWLVPAIWRGGPEFLDQLIWQQTIDRMATTTHHLRPFWFYIVLLPVLLFPLWLLPASWRGLSKISQKYPALGPVLLSWTVPVFMAFSLFRGKQLHYLFPLLPAVAVWLAAASTASSSGYKKILAPAAKASMVVVAVTYLAIGVWFKRAYDVEPVSQIIAGLQRSGVAVAHLGRYHGQFQFAGRLERPLIVIRNAEDWRVFTTRFPKGYVITYSRHPAKNAVYSQRFRSTSVFMMPVNALSSTSFDELLNGSLQTRQMGSAKLSHSD